MKSKVLCFITKRYYKTSRRQKRDKRDTNLKIYNPPPQKKKDFDFM